MFRRAASCLFSLAVIAFMTGASTITLDKVTNPAAGNLKGEGTYKVDPAETFLTVQLFSENTKTQQLSAIKANAANGKWDGTLSLVAANYDAWGVLVTKDAKNETVFTDSKKKNIDVK